MQATVSLELFLKKYVSVNSQKVGSFLYANQHVQGKCLDCDKASNTYWTNIIGSPII